MEMFFPELHSSDACGGRGRGRSVIADDFSTCVLGDKGVDRSQQLPKCHAVPPSRTVVLTLWGGSFGEQLQLQIQDPWPTCDMSWASRGPSPARFLRRPIFLVITPRLAGRAGACQVPGCPRASGTASRPGACLVSRKLIVRNVLPPRRRVPSAGPHISWEARFCQ